MQNVFSSLCFTPRSSHAVVLTQTPLAVDLHHTHIQFAHCYKHQDGWARKLFRFARGGGVLYNLEFLTSPSGGRVAAMGYYAGYAGGAVALFAWSHQLVKPNIPLPKISSYDSETLLIHSVRNSIALALPHNGRQYPRVIIIGALGRCGSGAIDLCLAAGIPASNLLKWDMAETAPGGPFPEITASDIFINCIYLTESIPPFVTLASLAKPGRKLRVACDVSCDPDNPYNPMPIYHDYSTFDRPTIPVHVEGDGQLLDVVSIDNLPSLLPREASESFSRQLLPSLMLLDRRHEEAVWVDAEKLFRQKIREIPL